MFIPLGLEDKKRRRIPFVSIGIAVVCIVVFVMQSLEPDPTSAAYQRGIGILIEHPYILPPPAFEDALSPNFVAQLEAAGAGMQADPNVAYEKQRELEDIADEVERAKPKSFAWRWGLVPSRGFIQSGWLTSLFIHFGFGHIFFNLLFFYVVGPALEDRWGHVTFLLFYLAGGAFAALAHFALDPTSRSVLGGASGAIAACIGAFAFAYATERVRILLFLFVFWKRFGVPAWVWSAFWFVSEVSTLTDPDGFGGVAVMAHVGGWMFGFIFAFGLTAVGLDRKLASRGDPQLGPAPSVVPGLIVGGIVLLISIPIVLFAMPQREKDRPKGTITISSKPPGATIFVDGARIAAKTPYEIDARLRRLTRVQVALDAHRSTPLKHDVVLTASTRARAAHFDLVRTAPMNVATEPPGARVTLDGRPAGVSPLSTAPLDIGKTVKVVVVLDGYMTVEREVRVERTTTVELALVPSRRMAFESEPEGATLLIDGVVRGRTPIDLEVPKRRRFAVRLEKAGFRSVTKRMRARASAKFSLRALPLSKLPLDADERRRLAELNADRRRFAAELTRLKRRLAKLGRAGAGSVYDRIGAENQAEDLRVAIEDLQGQRAVVDEEMETVRRSAIDRMSR